MKTSIQVIEGADVVVDCLDNLKTGLSRKKPTKPPKSPWYPLSLSAPTDRSPRFPGRFGACLGYLKPLIRLETACGYNVHLHLIKFLLKILKFFFK
jgi:hypothetical protein